jgi:hypothetical protein
MGSRRIGLGRIETLLENQKRDLALGSTTLTDVNLATSGSVTYTSGAELINHANGFTHGTLTQTDTNERKVASIDLTNALVAGNVVRIKVSGVTTAKTGTPTNLSLFATFNTSDSHAAGSDVPIVTLNTTAPETNKSFTAEFNLVIESIGAGGKVAGHAFGLESNDGVTYIAATSAGAVSVDTTTHKHLHLAAVTAGGDGSNHATTKVSVDFEILGAKA